MQRREKEIGSEIEIDREGKGKGEGEGEGEKGGRTVREVANDFERNPHNPTMARQAPQLYLPMLHVTNRPHLQNPSKSKP
jgi:hypothetical protein